MKSHIVFILTTRCNFRCKHCIRDYYSKQTDLSLSIARKALKEAKELGFKHVALTGGEPILHPKFDKMVDLICSYGLTWSVVTNGSMFKKYEYSIKKHGKECTFFSVSLDGLEKNHDCIHDFGK